MEVKYYTLSDFHKTLFLPFGEAVNSGCYEKMPYKQWRNLNNWSKELKYEQMRIAREMVRRREEDGSYSDFPQWFVGPSDHNLVVPNPEVFDIDDNSFGNFLENTFIRNVIKNITISGDEIKSAIYPPMEDMCEGLTTFAKTSRKIEANLDEMIDKICKQIENKEKENNKMKFGNFDFGPVDSSVRMSLYGMAIRNASGTYVAYDENSKSIMDVDILNFEGASKFIYKMPVALKEVRCGDVIIHARKPMFVQATYTDGRFKVLDVFDGEEKTIVPARSPFGFDFMTKVVSFVNFTNADNANPFGNLLPLMLLNDGNAKDNDALMLAMAMGNNIFGNISANPLMVYALMNEKGNQDVSPLMLLALAGGFGAQPAGYSGNCSRHECSCDKDNNDK